MGFHEKYIEVPEGPVINLAERDAKMGSSSHEDIDHCSIAIDAIESFKEPMRWLRPSE